MTDWLLILLLGFILGWVGRSLLEREPRKLKQLSYGDITQRRLVDGKGNEVRLIIPLNETKLRKLAVHVTRGFPLTYSSLTSRGVMTRPDWKKSRPVLIRRGCITTGTRGEALPTHRLIEFLRDELNG